MSDNQQSDIHKQMVFEANRKSVGVAYLLWFLLGWLGVHRFYAGHTKTGVIQMVLLFTVVGWLVLFPWLLLDLVLIPGLVRETNMKTIAKLAPPPAPPPPLEPGDDRGRPLTEADRKRQEMLEDLRATGYRKERRDTSHLYR